MSLFLPVIMEDLGSYQTLQELLFQGKFNTSLIGDIVRCIAKLHRATHRATVDEAAHREMVQFTT